MQLFDFFKDNTRLRKNRSYEERLFRLVTGREVVGKFTGAAISIGSQTRMIMIMECGDKNRAQNDADKKETQALNCWSTVICHPLRTSFKFQSGKSLPIDVQNLVVIAISMPYDLIITNVGAFYEI